MERQISKRNYFLKTLTILFLSIILLLPTLMLEGSVAKAAPVAEDRSVDLSKCEGDLVITEDEVVRVYQTTATTSNSVMIPAKNATVILDGLNIISDKRLGQVQVGYQVNTKVFLKGKNKLQQTSEEIGTSFLVAAESTCVIEDYGDGDGSLEVSNSSDKAADALMGGWSSWDASMTINSGSIKATSKGAVAAIGAGHNTKNFGVIINGGTVEAHAEGWGAAIGIPGDLFGDKNSNDVNITINGGEVIASNRKTRETAEYRSGAVIGSGYFSGYEQKVTLNIPEDSTAELDLTSNYGGAAIGTGGSWTGAQVDAILLGGGSSEEIIANIAGGNIKINADGQAAGIGTGAAVSDPRKVEANISGGNVSITNSAAQETSVGPGIGVGVLAKGGTVNCNISGGNVNLLSKDSEGITVNAPAMGIGARHKNHIITNNVSDASGNTFNLNVTGGTINAETRSTDTSIPDIGTIENNTFNVKVDGGSLNAVNQRMNVTATNSEGQNVYPATVNLGGITTGNTDISSASIGGKDYGKNLVAQSGKLYLWTNPGENKAVTASVNGDSKAYSNSAVTLAYDSGFTFTNPDVTLKKTITPEELGSFSIKNVTDSSVTIQVGGVNSDDLPVLLQAYEHGTTKAVGEPQTYEASKTECTFSGLTKNKLYDIKISENDTYWSAEKVALVVKPFEYTPALPDATLKNAYEASVAIPDGNFTYALASGAVLPEGLTLNKNGMVSGTPTQAGDFKVNITATAADEGISANNSRTAAVAIKVKPVEAVLSVVDQAGQPLSCGCELTSTAAKGGAAVGDTVLFTLTPCPLHDFVKFNLNGNEVQAVPGSNGKFTYSYIVKAGDTEMNMKAFMKKSEKRITKIERVGEEKAIAFYANDERNESPEDLKAYVNNNVTLKATYNDGEEKTGKATELGLAWATNSAYSVKGGTYDYSVSAEDTRVAQKVVVNTVTAELSTLNDVIRSVNEAGYPSIASLGLPETVACTYQTGVPVNSADREVAIDWTTAVPENFGKTATETPFVFEGNAAVPAWATIESTVVSANVSISDQVVLAPVVTIKDKIYDGTKTADFADTPTLNPDDLTQGTDVHLSGIPKAEFILANAGKNIPVKISGLSLVGADADKYILDLSQATGNITPAPISLAGITMENKTVTEDGNPQTIEIKGSLPEGVSVSYTYQREGASEAVELPPSVPGTYTVTAIFKTDANHVVDPETMSAKLVIEEKSTGVVVEEITTGLTEEQAAGMNATVLKNGEAVQAGDTVAAGDKLTYQFAPAAVREAYVPYAFTMNGETVEVTKLAEGKGYSAEYTVKEGDTALKADAKCVLVGNFDGNDKINILDAQKIALALASGDHIEAMQKAAGDVNFDGKINILDAQKIALYLVDTSSVF